MATTVANVQSTNKVEPPKIKVVNTIPDLAQAEIGEMYLLISDSATDDKKLHIRATRTGRNANVARSTETVLARTICTGRKTAISAGLR